MTISQNSNRNAKESPRISKWEFASGLIALPLFSVPSCVPTNTTHSKGETMEKVQGIGGFFFRSEDPEKLRNWYRDHLGVELAPQFSGGAPWQQEAGYTVFDPFPKTDTMIPEGKSWMINFRVGDLAKMIEQLQAADIKVSDLEEYPHGKFTILADPEGNSSQLWEPMTM